MMLGKRLVLGWLAIGLAATLATGCGGDTDGDAGADVTTSPDGSVGLDGTTPSDGSAEVDGVTPGAFVPVALLVGGDRGERKLFTIDLELTQTVEISHDGAYVATDIDRAFILDVAPNGRHVAYAESSPAEVYVAPTDRSGGAVMVGEGAYPARVSWAPDGSRLLYLLLDDEGANGPLMSVLPDGSGAVMLGDDVAHFEWSPDSTRVLYTTDDQMGGEPGAYVVAADGTGQVDLVAALADSAGVTGLARLFENDVAAAWSPDGARIAIAGDWPHAVLSTPYGNIYMMDPDGTNVTQIAGATDSAGPYYRASGIEWAPDGSRVAFYVTLRSNDPATLHTMLPDGTGEATTDAAGYRLSGWSADSRHVAFTASRSLRVAPADTLASTELVRLNSMSFAPGYGEYRFSPDSASVAYHSDEDGEMELFVAGVDGTNPTKVSMPLTGVQPVQHDFFWSEDSGRLFYRADDSVIEVARPSTIARAPVSALTYAEAEAQVRAWVETVLPGDCEIFRVSSATELLSVVVADCHHVSAACGPPSERKVAQWAVCRETGTNRWVGAVNTFESVREIEGIVRVYWR